MEKYFCLLTEAIYRWEINIHELEKQQEAYASWQEREMKVLNSEGVLFSADLSGAEAR